MMPVLVIEHTHGEGPGHFGAWLAERGRPMTLVRVHAGDTVPVDLDGWVVNDRLEAEALSGVPTAQSPAQIAEGCRTHLGPMRRLAFRIYDTWAGGLAG